MKSKYQGVKYISRYQGKNAKKWQAKCRINGVHRSSMHHTEEEAAKAYDRMRIAQGKEPVNLLTRKK